MTDPSPPKLDSTDPPPLALIWRFADIEYDTALGELRVGGVAVAVERRPLRLLEVLLAHVNEVVTKDELFETVWAGRSTVEHVLTNAVSKLRSALGPAAAVRLVTVPRAGYRLLGPVQRVAAPVGDFSATIGQPVPGADGYLFERALGSADPPTVWLARHPKLGLRHVFKFATEGRRLAALRREHTLYRVLLETLGPREDVARLVGTNFSTAPFFLKCEFGGESLLDWAEHDGLTALPIEERLGLFVRIARAVAAAHSVGVLHKDLKPGNVLIEAEEAGAGDPGDRSTRWKIRLTDFGSGRLLDPAQLDALRITALEMTQTQSASGDSRSGTPMYLAPELIAGHAPTAQSDVYALGVLLFQLLAGDLHRPMVTGWQRDVADPLLVEDITAATEGDPTKRLGSAGELADRVQALAERRRAREEAGSAAARAAADHAELSRRRARRPWMVGAMIALVLGAVISIDLYVRAGEAYREARQEADKAEAINGFLTEDVLQSPDMMLVGGSRMLTLLDVLRRSATRVGERFAGQPRIEAAARQHLARIYRRNVSTTDANGQYEAAIALLEPRVPVGDPQLLGLRFEQVGLLHREGGETKEAASRFAAADRAMPPGAATQDTPLAFQAARAAVEILPAQPGPAALAAASRLERLASRAAGIDDSLRIEARLLLARLYLRLYRRSDADRLLMQSGLAGDQAEAARIVTFAMHDMWTVAPAYRRAGRLVDAEALLLQTIDRLARSPQPSVLHLAYAHSDLANVYYEADRFQMAVDEYRKAADAFGQVLGNDHQSTRITRINIAQALKEQGRYNEAFELISANRSWFKDHSPNGFYEGAERALAETLLGLGRPAEALGVMEALPIDPDDPDWLWIRGFALMDLGRDAEGRAVVQKALNRFESEPPPPWLVARLEARIGMSRPRGH